MVKISIESRDLDGKENFKPAMRILIIVCWSATFSKIPRPTDHYRIDLKTSPTSKSIDILHHEQPHNRRKMSSDDSESISTTNSFVQSLLTDLYQITMAYGYWRQGKHDETAVFELFFRKTPFHGEFVIFTGLGDCIEFVKKFRFSECDITYLKTVLPENTDPAFFDYLSRLDCKAT